MFRLLLKLLGLEKYEYPESKIGIVKNNTQSTSINSQPAPKQEAEIKPEAKQQIKTQAKPEPKQQIKPETKPEPKQQIKPEAKPKPKQQIEPEAKPDPIATTIVLTAEMLVDKYSGLKSNYAKMLIDAGFDDLAKIEQASDKELEAIKGIGKATVKLLRRNS